MKTAKELDAALADFLTAHPCLPTDAEIAELLYIYSNLEWTTFTRLEAIGLALRVGRHLGRMQAQFEEHEPIPYTLADRSAAAPGEAE